MKHQRLSSSPWRHALLAGLLSVAAAGAHAQSALKAYNVDPSTVSVSGMSSEIGRAHV